LLRIGKIGENPGDNCLRGIGKLPAKAFQPSKNPDAFQIAP
jgi:hypothetical protein